MRYQQVAAAVLASASVAAAQAAAWGQCGGQGWTGATTCVTGWTCVYQNDWYSQCLQSSSTLSTSTKATTTTMSLSTTTTTAATGIATIHLCGDSTMAKNGGGSGTEGWGQYLQYSFDKSHYVVSNHAIGGRSARSYTRENRFYDVSTQVKSGDWVVIEFGHNDGGSLSTDNGRTDCFGADGETCTTVYNGVTEIVYTYPTYIKNATQYMLNAGAAGVIISAPTPNNVCETGTCSWAPYRFDYYAYVAATEMGGAANHIYYVPHGAYAAQAMINLGATTVNAGYPIDHTHTGPYMADVMAKSFVLGLKCGSPISRMGTDAINSTSSLTSTFLGGCISLADALVGYI